MSPFQSISDYYPNTQTGIKNWERGGKLNQHTPARTHKKTEETDAMGTGSRGEVHDPSTVKFLSNFPVDHIPLEIVLPSRTVYAQCFGIIACCQISQFMRK